MKKKNFLIIIIAVVVISISAFFVLKNEEIFAASINTEYGEHTTVVFTYKGNRWTYDRKNYEIDSDIHSVKQEIKERIKPTHKERIALCETVKGMGFSYQESVEYAFFGIEKVINLAKKNVDLAPKDATIKFNPDKTPMFIIKPEQTGYNINLEKVYEELYNALKKSSSAILKLKPENLYSTVTSETLRACTKLRSKFSTTYSESLEPRKHNVRLALNKFNGFVIKPAEIVSFNTVVGPRSARNGFQEAKIIKNGQYEDGIGGGVCQSSTTLYNALILADVNIKKVSQHSLTCSYVDPSFDAMVNSSWSDLVFENTGDLPVFIRTFSTDKIVGVEIYGTSLPYEIRRRSVVTSVIPHSGDKEIIDTTGKYIDKVQYKGDKVRVNYPKDGLTSEGYLDYYKNGKLINSKRIRKNKYSPQAGLIVEGTQKRPPEPIPEPEKQENETGGFFELINGIFGGANN